MNNMFYTEQKFIDFMINVVKECNDVILDVYNSDFKEELKDDDTPLTKADCFANEIICNNLKVMNSKLNMDILLISEEITNRSYDERKVYDWCWIIDPVDGTKEFVSKNGQFTVNIGLTYKGVPVFGIVSIPVTGEIYYGAKDLGSYKLYQNGTLELLKVGENHNPIKICVSNSHLNNETKEYLTKFDKYDCINVGSSIKLLWIAENKVDLYPRLAPTSEWDICAAHAVVKYAGGQVIQYGKDKELEYNKEDLLNPYFIVSK
jgi:3'(2'), 5'-bisphosphate nucleotidase